MNTATYMAIFIPGMVAAGQPCAYGCPEGYRHEMKYVHPTESNIRHHLEIIKNESRTITYIDKAKTRRGRVQGYRLAEVNCPRRKHRYLGKFDADEKALENFNPATGMQDIQADSLEEYQYQIVCAKEKFRYRDPQQPGRYHNIDILQTENKKVAYIDKLAGGFFGRGSFYRFAEVDCGQRRHRYFAQATSYKQAMKQFTEDVPLTEIRPDSLEAAQYEIVCPMGGDFEAESEFESP